MKRAKGECAMSTLKRAPVAQLVQHRAVTRQVVSSASAGPSRRVLK